MGSFRAHLELGGTKFDVLFSEYSFSRSTDKKGKVSSNVIGGRVTVEIESTEDTSVIEAMLNSQFKSVEGKLDLQFQPKKLSSEMHPSIIVGQKHSTLKNSKKRSEQLLYSFFCTGNRLLFE